MFLKKSAREAIFTRTGKDGKKYLYTRKKKLYHLRCDSCNSKFVRDSRSYSEKRNSAEHFCSDCYSLEAISKNRPAKVEQKKIGKTRMENGYVLIYVGSNYPFSKPKSGCIKEHTYIMETHLNRQIKKGYVVHHIDGDKLNNQFFNLVELTVEEHNTCHARSQALVFTLVRKGIVEFDRTINCYQLAEGV